MLRVACSAAPCIARSCPLLMSRTAESVFTSQDVKDWLIKGTPVEVDYVGSRVLIDEQRVVRWRAKPTKQPFWANYWCGRDSSCTCRIEGSKGLESDAIFFFSNS